MLHISQFTTHLYSASDYEHNTDMDFVHQPQRPTRTLRAIYGDENVVPAAGTQKTLHQRNKSSPALSTIHQAGGLKPAAKRTAFGDVSNTANVSRPSKDDLAVGAKGGYSFSEKPMPTLQDKKISSFLRPAQRPLSVSGLKGLLNNVASSTNLPSVKQPLVDTQQPLQSTSQAANTRKLVTKNSTAVFKDAIATQPQSSAPEEQKPLPTTAPIAPVHREPQPPQQYKDSNESQEPQLTQTKMVGQFAAHELAVAPSAVQAPSEEPAMLRSDGIYIDQYGQVQFYGLEESITHVEVLQPSDKGVLLPVEVPSQKMKTRQDQVLDACLVNSHPEPNRRPTLASVSEPEEYWDDEGEENYDEEGYATARSFKSRGENTTGGATTVLFPKVNLKTRKEIAAAKELIEGSKTVEELEDEAWDTTMVAEYGEEIFQYMKDLEVREEYPGAWTMLITYNRSRCCQTHTTWITRQRYSGRCVQY